MLEGGGGEGGFTGYDGLVSPKKGDHFTGCSRSFDMTPFHWNVLVFDYSVAAAAAAAAVVAAVVAVALC